MVSAHNPYCDVSFDFTKGVLDLPEDDPLWGQDFVVSTIADDLTELALNRLAVGSGRSRSITCALCVRAPSAGSCGSDPMLTRASSV